MMLVQVQSVMAIERPEHGLVVEPEWGIKGQKVHCRRIRHSMVGIMVRMMMTMM